LLILSTAKEKQTWLVRLDDTMCTLVSPNGLWCLSRSQPQLRCAPGRWCLSTSTLDSLKFTHFSLPGTSEKWA